MLPIIKGKLLTFKHKVSSRFFTDAFHQTEEVPFYFYFNERRIFENYGWLLFSSMSIDNMIFFLHFDNLVNNND